MCSPRARRTRQRPSRPVIRSARGPRGPWCSCSAVLITAPFMILALGQCRRAERPLGQPPLEPRQRRRVRRHDRGGQGQGLTSRARTIRRLAAVAFGLWMLANVTWGLLAVVHANSIPSIADTFVVALVRAGRPRAGQGRSRPADRGRRGGGLLRLGPPRHPHRNDPDPRPRRGRRSHYRRRVGVLALAYPTAFIGLAAAGTVALQRGPSAAGSPRRVRPDRRQSAIIGLAYLGCHRSDGHRVGRQAGSPASCSRSGRSSPRWGAATWRDETDDRPRYVAATRFVTRVIGPTAASVSLLALLLRLTPPVDESSEIGAFVAGILVVIRQALLLRERTHTLDEVRTLHDENDRLVGRAPGGAHDRATRPGPDDQDVPARRRRRARGRRRPRGQQPAHRRPRVRGAPARGLAPDDPSRADVETIRDEALRARTIVRALRDFARPREPQLAPTDLSELVTQDDRPRPLPAHPERGYHPRVARRRCRSIELDPQAIQQVILNVLTNAMQAMPRGRRATGSRRRSEGHGRS